MKPVKIKRLFFDIETSPNIVFSWNVGYKLQIGHDNILKERAVICICYKWEGEDTVHSLEWKKGDDKSLITRFLKVILKADEVIGHNGDNYDIKWFKTRALFHGIPSLPDIKSIDTLKLARKGFRFNSNKLDYIGKFLGLGQKLETGGFGLWKDICIFNNADAMHKMVTYCKQDVLLLEQVFQKLQGYGKPKTHTGVLKGKDLCSCPYCASDNTVSNGNIVAALGTIKKKMKCLDCIKYFSVSQTAYKKSRQ